jgi:glutathione S-transferase
MKLFSATYSPNGKRVRIGAAELGIELEPVVLDYTRGEHRSPDYLALNPMGKWPTLQDGDLILWESPAILLHLAHKKPGVLWPSDPAAQADTMRWLFFTASHLDPYFTTLVVERFIKPRRGEPSDEAALAGAEAWLARFVPVVEEHLRGRPFLVGRFGLADITMGCTLELSPLVRYDLSKYPEINRWLAGLQARPTWIETTPPASPNR